MCGERWKGKEKEMEEMEEKRRDGRDGKDDGYCLMWMNYVIVDQDFSSSLDFWIFFFLDFLAPRKLDVWN